MSGIPRGTDLVDTIGCPHPTIPVIAHGGTLDDHGRRRDARGGLHLPGSLESLPLRLMCKRASPWTLAIGSARPVLSRRSTSVARRHPSSHGHFKDHRLDLQRLRLTGFAHGEGIPWFGTVESGPHSDKPLNGEMPDRLVEAMAPDQLAQLTYGADSALMTGPNWVRSAAQTIALLSRCPEPFGVLGGVNDQTWAEDTWTQLPAFRQQRGTVLGRRPPGRNQGASYPVVVDRPTP